MSLATINVENVTLEKFAAVVNSANTEFKGHFTKGTIANLTTGTLQDHGSTVDYTYDSSKNLLVFDIVTIGRVFFHKPSVAQVKEAIIKWVEDAMAEATPQNTSVLVSTDLVK